jgi:hypothetical protein
MRGLDRLIYAGDEATFLREEAAFLAREDVAASGLFVAYYKENWQPIAKR